MNCCKQEVGNSYSSLTSFESINAWLNTAGLIAAVSFWPEKKIKVSTSHTNNIRQVYIYIYIYIYADIDGTSHKELVTSLQQRG